MLRTAVSAALDDVLDDGVGAFPVRFEMRTPVSLQLFAGQPTKAGACKAQNAVFLGDSSTSPAR